MTEVKIPSPGESITEVELANWLVNDGDHVEKDQEIAEIESDKATLPLVAEASGKIEFLVEEGASLNVGETACKIDETVNPPQKTGSEKNQAEKEPPEKETTPTRDEKKDKVKVTPVAQKMMEDYNLSLEDVLKGLRRVTKQDVEVAREALQEVSSGFQDVAARKQPARETERKKMTRLRKKLSGRLVSVKNETAMLTTFNEADMSQVMEIREKYQQQFLDKHGIKLGLMSFFIKAVTKALEAYPNVNSMIDGDEIVYSKFADIGIAVQTPKGLMVPVIRNAESLSLAEIEKQVKDFAEKGKSNRISIEEMEGGTFSITNGGVFGSLLSTPILNPPQSAILGMHTIQERPVAVEGKVEIRPMMYLALSYDHRLIDGKESVGFLVKVKEMIENPRAMLFDGQDPVKLLLDL